MSSFRIRVSLATSLLLLAASLGSAFAESGVTSGRWVGTCRFAGFDAQTWCTLATKAIGPDWGYQEVPQLLLAFSSEGVPAAYVVLLRSSASYELASAAGRYNGKGLAFQLACRKLDTIRDMVKFGGAYLCAFPSSQVRFSGVQSLFVRRTDVKRSWFSAAKYMQEDFEFSFDGFEDARSQLMTAHPRVRWN